MKSLVIILPERADRVVRFAGAELKKYLRAIAGLEARVAGSESPLGKFSIRLGLESVHGDPDGFTIRTEGNCLSIIGRNNRSVLYGVYAFLERLGCRFIEPGIEIVPKKTIVRLPDLDVTDAAAFPLRTVFRIAVARKKTDDVLLLKPEIALPIIDWMAKRRLNHHVFYVDFYRYDLWEKHKAPVLNAFLDRGFRLEVTHHSLHYFCPPAAQFDFGGYGPKTYAARRPDWYVATGAGPTGWQTRVEKPAVQRLVIERYLAYVRANPELDIVGLWPDDCGMNVPYRGLSATDGYVKFWNKAAAALREEFPDKRLATIAYFELLNPPRRMRPAANTHNWFCPIDENFLLPLAHRRNKVYLDALKGWIDRMPPHRVNMFEYYGWSTPLVPYRKKMREDLRLYRELGLGGVYTWCGFTDNILGTDFALAPDLLAMTSLLWNPESDTEKILEEWAQAVFADCAGRILEFYDFLSRTFAAFIQGGIPATHYRNVRWLTLDNLHTGQKILAAARRKNDHALAAHRIDLLEQTMARHCVTAGPGR